MWKVDQPALGLARSTLLADEDNSTAPVLNAYRQYARAAAGAVRDWLKTNVSDADIAADVDAVVHFEADIAKVMLSFQLFANLDWVNFITYHLI